MAKGQPVSSLMLDEAFATQDARFVDLLRSIHDPKRLATFADRWAKDHRPWAREQVVEYLNRSWNAGSHETVVKRFFKYFESQKNDDMMGLFLARLDRSVRRKRTTRYQYDWRSRQSWTEQALVAPRDQMPHKSSTIWPGREMFSYRTRYYLRRRAWRYFRRMGFQDPKRYLPAISSAMRHFKDEDLAVGENILDSWGLMHALFGKSDLIEFTPSITRLRDGKKLADLVAEPVFPELWQKRDAIEPLFSLVADGQSRLVRVCGMQLLRRWHQQALDGLAIERLIRLFDHTDPEVQRFAAELFTLNPSLGTLPVETWLRLLGTSNLTALTVIVDAMEKHVAGERLTLSQLVRIACARPVPVVRLAMKYLQGRAVSTAEDRETLAGLSSAECEIAGGEIAKFALGILGTSEHYNPDQIIRFFDSTLLRMRLASWEWLSPASAGWSDARLWSRLIESPYDDVRLRLVQALRHRLSIPGADSEAHAHVWGSVLLGIHRGGRTKLIAMGQISRAIREHPEDAERLLPVLAVAIRSVRLPEARVGLSAIVSAVDARPELEAVVSRYLPELKLNISNATAGAA